MNKCENKNIRMRPIDEMQQQVDEMYDAANKLIDGITDIMDYEDWVRIQILYKDELDILGVI